MNNFKLYRKCPICGSSNVKFLWKINFELFEKHPLADGYDVVLCKICSFLYANVKSTQKDFDQYYEYLSRYEDDTTCTGGGVTEYDRERLNGLSTYIESKIEDKQSRVLDVGCANGGLLRILKNKGFDNIIGVDPSINCVNETIKSVGCVAFKYSLFELSVDTIGKFDLIIFSHVMEHILDIHSAINILKNLLKDNGLIYIECPNAYKYHELVHAPFQEFNTEHINHFTQNSLENLLVKYGFEEIDLGNRIFQISSGEPYNAVFGLFQYANNNNQKELKKDRKILEAVEKYIEKSQRIFKKIEDKISTLNNTIPILIYGLGQLSYKILKSSSLKGKNIKYLIDNNPINRKKKLLGISIKTFKDFLLSFDKKEEIQIVIMSTIYENDIKKDLINKIPNVKVLMGFSDIVKK